MKSGQGATGSTAQSWRRGTPHHHDGIPHVHSRMNGPGEFSIRELGLSFETLLRKSFTVGIGGPVGSGKTALLHALCSDLRDEYSLGVVTNDIFTREDAEFLTRHKALEP